MKMMSWSRYHCLPWYLMHIRIRPRRGGLIRAGHTIRRRRHSPADNGGAGYRAPACASKPNSSEPNASEPSASEPSVSEPSISNS
jgi:hypothetical protein